MMTITTPLSRRLRLLAVALISTLALGLVGMSSATSARQGYTYDPSMQFFSSKYKSGEMVSRKCNFRTAYRNLSQRSVRTRGLKLKNLEQRMYFLRTISVAYLVKGKKATAKSYAMKAQKLWLSETGELDDRGNPETFGGLHQTDTIGEAYNETQEVKYAAWTPSTRRYDHSLRACQDMR